MQAAGTTHLPKQLSLEKVVNVHERPRKKTRIEFSAEMNMEALVPLPLRSVIELKIGHLG